MRFKDGQASIFLILSVLILFGGFLFFALDEGGREPAIIDLPVLQMKQFVQGCLERAAAEGLQSIGKHGGYHTAPDYSWQAKEVYANYIHPESSHYGEEFSDDSWHPEDIWFPYYVLVANHSPERSRMEAELARSISAHLDSCVGNFSPLNDQGVSIEKGEKEIAVTIFEGGVSFLLDWPLLISQGHSQESVSRFSSTLAFPLERMLGAAGEITALHLQDPVSICMSCLFELSERSNLSIQVFRYPDNALIYTITATNTSIAQSYNLSFAIGHGTP